MISLRHITIRRGPRVLLDNIDWTIYAQQRIGLVGANGSGKSTLFSLLLGEFSADAGDLDIPRQLRFAHVAQETPASNQSALDYVLDGDIELRLLQAELQHAEQQDQGWQIAELHEKLRLIDAYTAPARAAALLAGLGFHAEEQQKPVSDFSGGWRVRLNLAKALMCRSDILLLDEPTNHLDLDAILWLENWLSNYTGILLLISHDREFLDNTINHIAHITNQQLTTYTGHYSSFEAARAANLLLQQAIYEKQQKQLAHMHSFVERFRYKASKARQAQSRLKAIERMEIVSAVQTESPFQFSFKSPKHAPNPLLAIDQATIAYDKRIILRDIHLTIAPKDRIAILGPNGAGKSSLIKLLAGELAPSLGTRTTSSGLTIGYFAQQQVDYMSMDASPFSLLRDIAAKTSESELRQYLGQFDFTGERIFEPIHTLSGGEKSRLALALIIWQKPNLLLLDEPTNHLDLEMRNALSIALQSYDGAMIVVSHDRFLVRSTTDTLLLCADQRLAPFDGDLSDYQQWLLTYRRRENPVTSTTKTDTSKKSQRQQNAKQRERHRPLQDNIRQLENQLSRLQQQVSALEDTLTDQSLYEASQKEKLQDALRALSLAKKELEDTEIAWLRANEEYEAAKQQD